jgi:hypothetical protein
MWSLGEASLRIWPWLTAAVAGWVAYRWILWSRRGFDFQDEGAYLLISQNPWQNSSPSFYGFLLHPLYLLSLQDPGLYRLLSVLLLAAAAGACAYTWWRRQEVPLRALQSKAGIAALCMTGALLVYSDGQRTPSYNTLVFFGALLAWTGYFGLSLGATLRRGCWWLLVLGIVLAFLAKWPAGVILAALFVFLAWKNRLYQPGDGVVIFGALLVFGVFIWGGIGKQGMQDIWRMTKSDNVRRRDGRDVCKVMYFMYVLYFYVFWQIVFAYSFQTYSGV